MSSFGIADLSPALEADLAKRMLEVEALLRLQIEGKYPLVIETSRHLVEAGGKRLRPLLTLITSHYGDPTAHGIIEAADRRVELSASGRQRARQLTWRRSAERTLAVYRELAP